LSEQTGRSIFVGTDGGSERFDRKTTVFQAINNPTKCKNNVVKTLLKTPFWLGYFNGGLALYNSQKSSLLSII
jgi:hypothetical protein